jgi:uncharacterized membrane protein YfcA
MPTPEPIVLALAALGVFVISFMRGAFGGGFAILGIPLLSLGMDPVAAGAFLAPMLLAMDAFALRYWKPSTWSRPDLVVLLPGLIAGIALGFVLIRALDRHLVSVLMAAMTLAFSALWLFGGKRAEARPRSPATGIVAGTASGVTTMIAHSGGPPVAMYLLPRGLPKAVYAGTTSLFFTVGNLAKAGPWLALSPPAGATVTMMLLTLPAVPLGIWAGWLLHERLDQKRMYAACYLLLTVTGLKLLFDGLRGYGLI